MALFQQAIYLLLTVNCYSRFPEAEIVKSTKSFVVIVRTDDGPHGE